MKANVQVRYGLAALAIAGGALAASAAPALAAGPPVPPGCSFDQATGVETCVTTTTTTTTYGPVSTSGSASTTVGGVTGQQICTVAAGPGNYTSFNLSNIVLNETVTTTTTTQRHGLNGKVFSTSTATSTTLNSLQPGPGNGSGIGCGIG